LGNAVENVDQDEEALQRWPLDSDQQHPALCSQDCCFDVFAPSWQDSIFLW
jgi:hypothetical protein